MHGRLRQQMQGASTSNWLVAVLTILFVGMASDGSAQLLNPGFESPDASGGDVSGTADWSTFNQAYTTATFARTGTQCFKTFGPFVQAGGTGAVQALPAAPGDTWVAEVYALNASSDPIDNVDFGVLKIEFRDAGGNLAAGGLAGVDIFESPPINASTPQDTWTLLGIGTAPAPANTAFAQIVLVKVDMDGAQGGSIFWDDALLEFRDPTDVAVVPASPRLELHQNEPNPFNPATQIRFALSQRDVIDLSVYDVTGRRIVTLLEGPLDAGPHRVSWDGRAANGISVAAGTYRYVLRTSTGLVSRSMVLLK